MRPLRRSFARTDAARAWSARCTSANPRRSSSMILSSGEGPGGGGGSTGSCGFISGCNCEPCSATKPTRGSSNNFRCHAAEVFISRIPSAGETSPILCSESKDSFDASSEAHHTRWREYEHPGRLHSDISASGNQAHRSVPLERDTPHAHKAVQSGRFSCKRSVHTFSWPT